MLKEIVLIFTCLILGKLFRFYTGLSIPGSVFGMIFMLIFLKTGIIKEFQIKRFSSFLIDNMGFFFVPIGVGIALYLDLIKAELFPILGASLISTLIILWVVGFVSGGRK
jgi:holin-like protein